MLTRTFLRRSAHDVGFLIGRMRPGASSSCSSCRRWSLSASIAIGNPIDVLISPDATQQIREATIPAYGLDQPLWKQYLGFPRPAILQRRFRPLVHLQHAGARPDLHAPAGDAGTDAHRRPRRDGCWACRLACTQGIGPIARFPRLIMAISDARVFRPDFLDRAGADLHLRGARWAGCRQVQRRRYRFPVRGGMELPHRQRPPEAHAAAGAQPLAVQIRDDGAPRPRRYAGNHADRHRASFARAAGESEWTILSRHVTWRA